MSSTDWETILDALRNRSRRRVLVALLEHGTHRGGITVPDEVLPRGENTDGLQVSMVHQHLPHLEAAGFIRWDRDTHEVVPGPQFEEIRPVLELVHEHGDELPRGWV